MNPLTSPLITAIEKDNKTEITEILSVLEAQELLNEALVRAAFLHSSETSFKLLELGADISFNNYECVRGAICKNQLDLFKEFIKRGANPFFMDNDHIGHYTGDAAFWGSINVLRYLIEEHYVPYREYQEHCFKYACYYGHLSCVEYLYDKGVDINADNGFALIRACEKNQTHVVKYLIEKGVDLETHKIKALQNICHYGDLTTLDIFKTKNINYEINDELVVCAILNTKTDILCELLNQGGNVCASDYYILQQAENESRFELIDICIEYGLSYEQIKKHGKEHVNKYLLQHEFLIKFPQSDSKHKSLKI